jgi:nitrogen-specific signal transduction histidine kinase/ActR/RegA family two-component response regulator
LVFQDDSKARKAEAALRQSQKLEAIGNLAGGIAHDFNNILTSIMGFTELSLQDLQHETELHDNLTEVLTAGKRAKSLVKQILTFSRKGEQEKHNIQMNSILVENMKMLRSTIPSNITITEEISSEPITIHANASQMNQVIMNLVTNAVHAINDNGLIDIGLELIQLDKSNVEQYPDMMPGSYAKIYVSDTGCGISKENLNAIFDPYFTTKTPDKGTGLGLAVVHGIVKIHDGHITVYSEPGNGTTFHVYLPTTTQSFKKPAIQTETDIPQGCERILFVDDEPAITKLQKRFLERLGYAVTAKTSSLDALKTFRLNPDLFQLVITDMTMPEMTGDQLCQAVKEIKPDIPVILCTGFSEKINEKTALDFPVDGFLMKPIDIKKMAETVRNVLDKK